MAQYSSELIARTISVSKIRSGKVVTEEEARQAVENICGFFQVLQEWAEAEDGGGWLDQNQAKEEKRGII
jgi:hypothetical protein